MRKHGWLLLSLLVLVLASSTFFAASAQDWTTFRYDTNRSGANGTNSSSNAAKTLWIHSMNGAVWSSPAVAEGVVLVGAKDCKIYCLNVSTGELVWSYPVGHEVNSSPTIFNGTGIVGCFDGNVYCMNLSSGKPVWVSSVGGAVFSSPEVYGGCVFVGSGLQGLYCLNASNGDVLWSFPTDARVNSSPAIFEGVVYFVCNRDVFAVNVSSGREIWRQFTGSLGNTPCIFGGCVYVGSYDGTFFCLDAATGRQIWKYQTDGSIVSSAAAMDGCVFVGSEDNCVYCFNATNGEKLWQTATGYWVCSSPGLADGYLYVGSKDYNIYCFNASTGQIKWTYATCEAVDSSPAIVNNTLFVGSHDYHLYALTIYNSTTPPAITPPTSVAWGTLLFDGISLAVATVAVVLVTRSLYGKITNKPPKLTPTDKTQPWIVTHSGLLCAIAIGVFVVAGFVVLGWGPLWLADEQTYSQMAYHMVRSGDYLLPWTDGGLGIWTGKPPLLMWLMALSYQVFGVTNFAARIWSLLFGVLSLVAGYFLGKKLYNGTVGLLSVVVLGSFLTFFAFATHAMTDGPLLFFILASVYLMLQSQENPHSNRYAVLAGVCFGLALMTKQIEALLIPLITGVYYAVSTKSPRFIFTKRFILFWGVALLIFAPYVLYMNWRFFEFWDCYFVYSVFSRTVTPLEGHSGDYLFYFNYLATRENLLWIVLLPFAGALCVYSAVVKRVKADLLLVVWMVVVLGLFTVAQTKIYWYVLPVLPAFAFAIGSFIYRVWERLDQRRQNKAVVKG
ncbi:MAG: PQQ-binding-like beta-propeller repeat protein [Candidatus Bathyarchaeota archaeon]|nr:PQQ-binding-like beta-propeller repeat protein [Candidatus Bathyarchaeota archaeon]